MAVRVHDSQVGVWGLGGKNGRQWSPGYKRTRGMRKAFEPKPRQEIQPGWRGTEEAGDGGRREAACRPHNRGTPAPAHTRVVT